MLNKIKENKIKIFLILIGFITLLIANYILISCFLIDDPIIYEEPVLTPELQKLLEELEEKYK